MSNIYYDTYRGEHQLPEIMLLIQEQLSEPYSIYTYRYFTSVWPQLTVLCRHQHTHELIGVIIGKVDHHKHWKRGYIGMLAVNTKFRQQGIGRQLVIFLIQRMQQQDVNCDEVSLETETTNLPALRLYTSLGFLPDKRLARYYVVGSDAFRLKLWLNPNKLMNDDETNPLI